MVTASQVRAIAKTLGGSPRADLVEAIVRGWDDAVDYAKLTTRKRAAAFLGQIMTETGGLQILVESGAYRFETICKIFGEPVISRKYGGRGHSARITEAEARSIAALPVAKRGPRLFNRVYGVGNPSKAKEFKNYGPNDGWLYRGGGMMQTTGKSNYADKARKTGLPLVEHPELLQQPDPAFKAAYLEWGQDARANRTADAVGGSNKAELKVSLAANRRVINGGTNGLDHFVSFYAKALTVLKDYDAVPIAPEPEPEVTTLNPETWNEPETEEEAPPNVQPVGQASRDPRLEAVQERLKARRYSPGVIDGRWGSGTSGAMSGFMNDRGLRLTVPSNVDEFHEIADEVEAELLEAESEVQPDGSVGWFRPVSKARANADAKIIKELAPETVPAKRNFIVTLWSSIVAFFAAIFDSVSGYVMQAWDFFTDHKDVVDDHPGIVSTLWEKIAHIPVGLWLGLAGAMLAFVAYNSWSAVKTSIKAVQNGERQ